MEFFEAVEARRSCRHFTPESVPENVINKALDAALLAPNSSNMQLWQFYWIKNAEKKKQIVEACLSQPAAATAQELIVCVSRRDHLDRNRKLIIEELKRNPKMPKQAFIYYEKLMPLTYRWGFLNSWGWIKRVIMTTTGFFRAVPRGPSVRHEVFEVMQKSTALACENLMLAIAAQGYASCPMEGYDECRVKKALGLGRSARITMVIGIGKPDAKGIWGNRFRIPRNLVIHEI